MIELAYAEPFLRHQLPDVVASMLQISEAPGLEDGTRHLAIKFVVTLVASNTILSMAAELLRSQRVLIR
jgi:hypothetical protein